MAEGLDQTDRRIIAVLARDGRIPVRTLAEQLHISRANAYARISALRSNGVIRGYRADLDPVAIGLGTSAYITVNLIQPDARRVRERLQELPGVVHIAFVGGEFDVMLLVRVRNNADLRRLVFDRIQNIPSVVSTRTMLIFDEPPVMINPIADLA